MQIKLPTNDFYIPSEDTFFIAEHLENAKGKKALDIGTGSGYLTKILSSNFLDVVATDINFNSLASHKSKKENLVCCNGANAFKCKFDLIVCNLPYLPSEKVVDRTVDGGKEGIEVPLEIIKSVLGRINQNGRFLFLTSSLANYQKLIKQTKKLGFDVKIIANKKLFFEKLFLVEAKLKTKV